MVRLAQTRFDRLSVPRAKSHRMPTLAGSSVSVEIVIAALLNSFTSAGAGVPSCLSCPQLIFPGAHSSLVNAETL